MRYTRRIAAVASVLVGVIAAINESKADNDLYFVGRAQIGVRS